MNTERAAHDWEVRCHRLEVHDDMHREFAPEPIVVKCDKQATLLWQSGTFEDWDPIRTVVCVEHAIELVRELAGAEWELRTTTPADWEEYHDGAEAAINVPITGRDALVASYEGFDAVGWATPEHSHVMFDVAWEWTLTQRLAAVQQEEMS